MSIHNDDTCQALRDAAAKRVLDIAEQARLAAVYLEEGDYSAAATACHRAHQHKLTMLALQEEAAR